MRERQKIVVRIVGLLLIGTGILLNEWVLAYLFTADQHIDPLPHRLIIYLFQLVCIILGVWLTWKPPSNFPRRWDVAISCACGLLLLLAGTFVFGRVAGHVLWDPLLETAEAFHAKMSFYFADSGNHEKALGWSTHYAEAQEKGGSGVVLKKTGEVCPGYTLFADWNCSAHLIDTDGRVLYTWQKPYSEVSSEVGPEQDKGIIWRTVWPFPNGDMLVMPVNIPGKLYKKGPLLKLDRHSDIIWKTEVNAHHDMDVGPKGRIFVLSAEKKGDVRHDVLSVLSPGGDLLRKVDLLEALQDSRYAKYLPFELKGDILHTNNVELLSAEKATGFQRFQEGDILLSFLRINTIAVMDGKTFEIKWAVKGLTSKQHDPDFLSGGRIMVFDNEFAVCSEPVVLKSRIVIYDLSELGPVWSYVNPDLYTSAWGCQQELPNGNILITETLDGTLWEITKEGRVVWKYRSVRQADKIIGDGEYIGYLPWAQRYPVDYFNRSFRQQFHTEQ